MGIARSIARINARKKKKAQAPKPVVKAAPAKPKTTKAKKAKKAPAEKSE